MPTHAIVDSAAAAPAASAAQPRNAARVRFFVGAFSHGRLVLDARRRQQQRHHASAADMDL